ncbi:hypothetical protein DBR46_18325 [Pseudomonas sp. KBW05]|nr:hypothetical protein DBR46_18325 [Pseudomonas sp. KBW05]
MPSAFCRKSRTTCGSCNADFKLQCSTKCGSGLARECGVSVSDELTDPPLSRASPLPHWIFSVLES